ncbi:DUF975 domain-containing protein [Pleurocapsa sp. FMAR1]|uniref:DUF975 domain-containing protein n=1 Tax=Pleurocapsa sp. FMAR1 TaxID=3040204 RepID=UPI0029C7D006|nr:DUF975 domain-containing protein [Pleurocapsa sp. FMAR1]
MKPLSVGNVVSTGLRIYRDNFKKYFTLAFFGYLWILVPIYGLAKFSAMTGIISRLAFKEVAEQPETVRDAQRYVNPRMWSFLIAGILVGLILFGAIIPYSLIMVIALGIAGALSNRSSFGVLGTVVISLVSVAAILLFIFGIIWLFSKLFLVELPLAIEENANATNTIKRSWQLTKGAVGRIQIIVFLVFLISLPIGIAINILSVVLQLIIGTALENNSALAGIGYLLYIVFVLGASAFILPLWQSVKAVIYYDLRVRREGMGIDLRK